MVHRICVTTELNTQISACAAMILATGTVVPGRSNSSLVQPEPRTLGGFGLAHGAGRGTAGTARIGLSVFVDSVDAIVEPATVVLMDDPNSNLGSRWLAKGDSTFETQQYFNTRNKVPRPGQSRGRPKRAD